MDGEVSISITRTDGYGGRKGWDGLLTVDKSLSLLFDDDDGIPSTRPERSLAYRKSSALARFFPEETSRLDDEEVLSISAVGLNRYLDEYARISSYKQKKTSVSQ